MLASLTGSLTSYVRDHGVYAVLLLMLVDAVFPAASELVMVVGGALAAGAFGASVSLFGMNVAHGFWSYVVIALAGTIGYLVGAVLVGRITPVVRSFVSIPAGIFRVPLAPYTALTLAGSAIWAFALAGVGWGAGTGYERFHQDFGYVEIAVVAGVVLLAAYLVLRRRRSSTIS